VVDADFILHLNHDDAVRPVHFPDMAHYRRQRPGIRFPIVLAQRGEAFDALALPDLGARESILVGLHPDGHEAGVAVLPASEPYQDDALADLPGVLNDRIHDLEVVLAFLGLDPVPAHGNVRGVLVRVGLHL
jgi:hypothetical protein